VSDLYNILLTWVISYGPPVIGAVLLLGGIGLPVPASLLVIAAGAFSQQGVLDPIPSALIGYVAVVCGDSISYWIGKKATGIISPRFISEKTLQFSAKQFDKFGGWLIVASRSILSTLAIPTNLTAGSSAYPFSRYLLYDMFGEFLWILGYGSLGYVFGSAWEDISDFLTNTGGFLGMVVIIGVIAYFLLRPANGKNEISRN
jgi:membrane-associated protein